MATRERRLKTEGMLPLSPRIPPQWPSWSCRRELLEDSQDGWCACCNELPVKSRIGSKRFTCGREGCIREWTKLCQRDHNKALTIKCRELRARTKVTR